MVLDGFGACYKNIQKSESSLGSRIGGFPLAPAFGCSSCEPQSNESIRLSLAVCTFKAVEASTSETAKRDSAMRSEIVTKDLRF